MRLPLLVVAALAGMALAWLLPIAAPSLHPAAHVHLAFALGVMPLILAAMNHFVPVLSRSGPAPKGAGRAVMAAWTAGLVLTGFFVFNLNEAFRGVAALVALVAAASVGVWQVGRGRAALGRPHPGLYWYPAALACLVIGLLAVLAMALWPEHYLALKRLHLHLNLFGFIGLTAVGTLQVLLPTAAGRPDPAAAQRLQTDLILALGGALAIGFGAAWLAPLALFGAVLWLVPLVRLLRAWASLYRAEIIALHGAAPLLAAAAMGFLLVLVAGGAHGLGWGNSTGLGHFFVYGFLFPLVSGAAGQLLPLWLRPGQQTEWHGAARKRLTYGGGVRAAMFLAAGLLAGLGVSAAAWLALAALFPVVFAAAWSVVLSRSS